jgi:hypothetical protein
MMTRSAWLVLALSSALVACGGGGGGGSSTITVSGTVIDGTGAPMSGVNVLLDGDVASLLTTGADGKFSFSKVTRPYGLTLKSGTSIVEYRGLRRAAPRIAFEGGGLGHGVDLSGTVTGPTFPLPAGEGIFLGASNGVLTSGTASSATGAYSAESFIWTGAAATTTADVAALHMAGAATGITDYKHVGKRTGVSLNDGVNQSGLDIAATSAVTTSTTVFDYSLGAYTNLPHAGYWLLTAGGAQFFLGLLPWTISTGTTLKLPSEGASLVAGGEDADGNSAYRFSAATLGGTTTIDLPPTTALKNSLPADLATGVSKTPVLSWAPVSGVDLYVVSLSGSGLSVDFFLPGDTTTFTVPDYSALSLGLAGSTSYHWNVVAVDSADFTPDALVDPAASGFSELSLYTATDLGFYATSSTSFTTAP